MFLVKIALFLSVGAISVSMVYILVENSDRKFLSYATSPSSDVNTTNSYLMLQTLDGSSCGEFTTGGSVLTSAMHLIIMNGFNLNSVNAVVILSTHCISECLIVKSVIHKHNVPVVVLSLAPILVNRNSDVIIFQPQLKILADAFFTFIKSLRWNKFGIISYYSDFHEAKLADYVEFSANKNNVIISRFDARKGKLKQYITNILNKVEASGVKVLLLLTQEAPAILCAAYKRGMRWPYYGWLLYGCSMPDIKHIPTCAGSHSYLEGTVYPTYYTSPTTEASLEETAILLLHNASAYATQQNKDFMNALLQMQVPGIPTNTLESIQKGSPAVYFVQVINGTPSTIATVYNGTVLHNRWLLEDELPRGRLPVLVNTVYPTWLGALEITVCGTLITLTLLLYIYYRNEPEVKATSWSLSLLMFLGCYLILVYLILTTLRSEQPPSPHYDFCSLLVWMSGVGVSYTLILAVILVKLFRIYRIFYLHDSIGKLCSDGALAVYVFLLLIPTVIILTVMTILAPYQLSTISTIYTHHIEVQHVCVGDLGHYFTALIFYTIVLILFIAIAAIKTRKLRHRNFRNAKKVNAFLFMILSNGIFGLVLFKVSSDRGQYLSAYISLHATHCTLIFLCLGFLFLPKLHPIISRRVVAPMRHWLNNKMSHCTDS